MYVVVMSSNCSNLLKETEENGFNGDVLSLLRVGRVDLQNSAAGKGGLDDAYKELATTDCERYTGP